MCRDVCRVAKEEILRTLTDHASHGGASSVEEMISPILGALDRISTVKTEEAYRREERRRLGLPELNVYPREICKRVPVASSAITSRRNVRCGKEDIGVAWETKIEEVLERELASQPALLGMIKEADQAWTAMNCARARGGGGERMFRDVCDGQVFAEHPFLGDPNYVGPTRLAFSGYCDDVDVPNPLGTAAGHSKLYLCFLVLLNRRPSDRLTLQSINLAQVCLASDATLAGPEVLISGPADEPVGSTSLGANFRRADAGISIPLSDGTQLACRGWLLAWAADGPALGQICGTNRNFSAAKNPCNLCENFEQFHDQRDHKAFSFLQCKCKGPHLTKHARGCPCKWLLRTEQGDAILKGKNDPIAMQKAGITTFNHGFVRVPYVQVSRLGPKDPMHTFLEGVTRHRAAYTLFMFKHLGLATELELRETIVKCDYGGGVNPIFRPGYLGQGVFTKTKVTLPSKKVIWGPHKEAKLNYSAHGTLVFAIFSLELLRKFLPEGEPPAFWKAWVQHHHIVSAFMRTSFSMSDLMTLEQMVIRGEELHFAVPEYHDTWIPKCHWATHLALDIYRFGPPRFLWVMLMEMKNAHFKRGCKRSNNHDPVKATARFWVDQSAYSLKKVKSQCECDSSRSSVLFRGFLSNHPALAAQALHKHLGDGMTTSFSFVKLRGAHISVKSHLFVGTSNVIYEVVSLIGAHNSHFAWLAHLGKAERDPIFGSYVMSAVHTCSSHRLLELSDGVDVTPLWCLCDAYDVELLNRIGLLGEHQRAPREDNRGTYT